jgi:nicotinamidase-related amidase
MMDPEKTALVLIEYQNDFTSEGGTLHQAVKPVMDSTNMLANTVETVAKARALGATMSTRRSRLPTTITNSAPSLMAFSKGSSIQSRFARALGVRK